MPLPLLAAGTFLKSNWKTIIVGMVFVVAVSAGIMSITNSLDKSYQAGYNAGYSKANLEYSDKQTELLGKYNELRNSIEFLARDQADKADKQRKTLIFKTNTLLGKLEAVGDKLTNLDCSPSEVFIGGWNDLSKSNTTHIDP